MKKHLALLACLIATPALAEDESHHHASAGGIHVEHAWTPATGGPTALIYMDIENENGAEAILRGGDSNGRKLEIVGFQYSGGQESWQPLAFLPIAAGSEVKLEPRVLALRLDLAGSPLREGGELDMHVFVNDVEIEVHAEIGAAGATAHSHAGHEH